MTSDRRDSVTCPEFHVIGPCDQRSSTLIVHRWSSIYIVDTARLPDLLAARTLRYFDLSGIVCHPGRRVHFWLYRSLTLTGIQPPTSITNKPFMVRSDVRNAISCILRHFGGLGK